jgi:hypothetical protein
VLESGLKVEYFWLPTTAKVYRDVADISNEGKMKNQMALKQSAQFVTQPAFTIQTGTEASSGPREGVIVVFATPPATIASKNSPKSI